MYMQGYLIHVNYGCAYVVHSGAFQSKDQLRQGYLKKMLRREDVKQKENAAIGETIPETPGALKTLEDKELAVVGCNGS